MWLLIFVIIICIEGFLNNYYLQFRQVVHIKRTILGVIMEFENLISTEAPQVDVTQKRDKLMAVAHGGLAEELLGKKLTAEKIRSMKPAEMRVTMQPMRYVSVHP